jgi:hypothetical protein
MKYMNEDTMLRDMLFQDAKYKQAHPFVPALKIKEVFNKDYYTFHPFILERLICYWVHIKGLKLKQLSPDASELHRDAYITSRKKGGRLL